MSHVGYASVGLVHSSGLTYWCAKSECNFVTILKYKKASLSLSLLVTARVGEGISRALSIETKTQLKLV